MYGMYGANNDADAYWATLTHIHADMQRVRVVHGGSSYLSHMASAQWELQLCSAMLGGRRNAATAPSWWWWWGCRGSVEDHAMHGEGYLLR